MDTKLPNIWAGYTAPKEGEGVSKQAQPNTLNTPSHKGELTYLTRFQATQWFRDQGIPTGNRTLETYAINKRGPKFSVIHNRALYKVDDLQVWLQKRLK